MENNEKRLRKGTLFLFLCGIRQDMQGIVNEKMDIINKMRKKRK